MNTQPTGTPAPAQSSDIGYAFLGFFLPIVGLILYLVWKPTYPNRARCAGIGALISAIVTGASLLLALAIVVVYVIIVFAILGAAL